jgi:hypothetical protein
MDQQGEKAFREDHAYLFVHYIQFTDELNALCSTDPFSVSTRSFFVLLVTFPRPLIRIRALSRVRSIRFSAADLLTWLNLSQFAEPSVCASLFPFMNQYTSKVGESCSDLTE